MPSIMVTGNEPITISGVIYRSSISEAMPVNFSTLSKIGYADVIDFESRSCGELLEGRIDLEQFELQQFKCLDKTI